MLDLLLLVQEARGRQHDAAHVALRVLDRILTVIGGRWLSLATKLPFRWQERSRSWSMTGVLLTSDSSKPASTASTIAVRFGPWVEQPHLRLHGERV